MLLRDHPSHCHRRLQDLLHVLRARLAAPAAGPARVGRHVARQVEHREAALRLLRGGEDQVAEPAAHRAPAIDAARGGRVGGAHVHALVHPHLAALVEADHRVRHAELVDLRRRALRQDLRERDADRLADLDGGVEGAERDGLAVRRLEDRALRHDHVDGVEEPLVLRDRRIDHRGELRHRVAARVRIGVPHADQLGARVAARHVHRELVARDATRHVHVHVGVAGGVLVDPDVGGVGAVGPARDLGAEAPLGLGDVPVDRGAHHAGAVLRDQLLVQPHAELDGGDHRGEVAREARHAVVARQQLERVAAALAAVHELQTGNDQPLGPDLARVHREAARVLAARVALVRLQRLDHHDLAALVEDRRVHVVVGQVPAAVLRVVAHEHVARSPVVRRPVLEPVAHGERRDEEQLRDADRDAREPPVRVDHARVALVRLVDDRRRRAAPEVRRHLEADRLERAADDAGGDGVDVGARRERRAARDEPAVHFVGQRRLQLTDRQPA